MPSYLSISSPAISSAVDSKTMVYRNNSNVTPCLKEGCLREEEQPVFICLPIQTSIDVPVSSRQSELSPPSNHCRLAVSPTQTSTNQITPSENQQCTVASPIPSLSPSHNHSSHLYPPSPNPSPLLTKDFCPNCKDRELDEASAYIINTSLLFKNAHKQAHAKAKDKSLPKSVRSYYRNQSSLTQKFLTYAHEFQDQSIFSSSLPPCEDVNEKMIPEKSKSRKNSLRQEKKHHSSLGVYQNPKTSSPTHILSCHENAFMSGGSSKNGSTIDMPKIFFPRKFFYRKQGKKKPATSSKFMSCFEVNHFSDTSLAQITLFVNVIYIEGYRCHPFVDSWQIRSHANFRRHPTFANHMDTNPVNLTGLNEVKFEKNGIFTLLVSSCRCSVSVSRVHPVLILCDMMEKQTVPAYLSVRLLIVFFTPILLIIKCIAAYISDSLSIISSVVDSLVDLISGIIIWYTSKSVKSIDIYRYPQGKTRLEPIGLVILSCVMAIASFQIIIISLKRLRYGTGHIVMNFTTVTILVFTIFVKFLLWLYLRRYTSNNAKALSLDQRNDMLSNGIALVCGSIGYALWLPADPIGAFIIACYIFYSWWYIGYKQIKYLTGLTADSRFLQLITWICLTHDVSICKIDTVRAFHFGLNYLVEVDIVLHEDMKLKHAHDIGESLQIKIEGLAEVERAHVHIDYETEHSPRLEHKMP